MTLSINSTKNTELILKLDELEKIVLHESPRDQDILLAIHNFLKENKRDWQDISAIEVKKGPGTFTSLRLGIAIANTLSFALNIPINGLPLGQFVEPDYGKPPSISTGLKK